jgi:hypothetical protein
MLLFSSLERLIDQHRSRRCIDASMSSLFSGISMRLMTRAQLCNCSITQASAAFRLRSGDLAAVNETTWIADAHSLLTLCVISRSNNSKTLLRGTLIVTSSVVRAAAALHSESATDARN